MAKKVIILGQGVNAKTLAQQFAIHGVVRSCYICGKTIEQPEGQFDMYGEIVCQDCWDYNMYQALQDGGM